MAEYIEREELIARLKRNLDACNTGTIETLCFRGAIMIAQSLPAADVAPVVWCAYCKYLRTSAIDGPLCEHPYGLKRLFLGSFCSYGEYQTNAGCGADG